MNPEENIIQEQFDSLPAEIKSILNNTPWRERVKRIAVAENLDAEKASKLETETMLILYGILQAEEFLKNIITNVEADGPKAQKIEEAIVKDIFEDLDKQYELSTGPTAPIIITSETKEDALKELSRREQLSKKPPEPPQITPEIPPNNLPMIKPSPSIPSTNKHYEDGKDPYREPLV